MKKKYSTNLVDTGLFVITFLIKTYKIRVLI